MVAYRWRAFLAITGKFLLQVNRHVYAAFKPLRAKPSLCPVRKCDYVIDGGVSQPSVLNIQREGEMITLASMEKLILL